MSRLLRSTFSYRYAQCWTGGQLAGHARVCCGFDSPANNSDGTRLCYMVMKHALGGLDTLYALGTVLPGSSRRSASPKARILVLDSLFHVPIYP